MMRTGAVAVICMMITAVAAVAQKTVPAEHQGRWVPAKAMCDSPLAMVVTVDKVTFINGKDSETLGGIEMAGPGFFPPGYSGVQAVLLTEFDGQQPATITFNSGEKKGVGLAEFAPVQPNLDAANAYNARITKLSLAKRFALDKMPLKKCAK